METIKTLDLNEAIQKEIKLSDCTKLESAEQAAEITQRVKAKWVFGLKDSLGVNVGQKYYEMFAKSQELYIYEKGKDSICFGIQKDGSIYGPYDIDDKPVAVNILAVLNDETTLPPIEEVEDEAITEAVEGVTDMELEPLTDEAPEVVPEVEAEESEEGAEPTPEEEVEDDEEQPEIDEEEVFLNFLANNFEEDKVRQVCKLLDIEIEGEESPEEGEQEDSNAEETQAKDIKVEKEEAIGAEEPVKEAIDDGARTLVNSLKEALKSKSDLETLKSLGDIVSDLCK